MLPGHYNTWNYPPYNQRIQSEHKAVSEGLLGQESLELESLVQGLLEPVWLGQESLVQGLLEPVWLELESLVQEF
jgi:hypothetical protein